MEKSVIDQVFSSSKYQVFKATLMQIWKKISLYVRVRIKIIPWKFRILKSKNSRVIYPSGLNFS